MKYFLFIVLFIISISFVYLYNKETSFSPLKEEEFKTLFLNYSKNAKKLCSIDFLGLNFKSELFEFYSYKTNGIVINTEYPKFAREWEHKEITNNVSVSKWINCPIDTTIFELYEFTLTANNLDEKKCSRFFYRELGNPKNYYSYVYFNELENYFLLYSSENEILYYLRRKGF